jgi:hypothetical protein
MNYSYKSYYITSNSNQPSYCLQEKNCFFSAFTFSLFLFRIFLFLSFYLVHFSYFFFFLFSFLGINVFQSDGEYFMCTLALQESSPVIIQAFLESFLLAEPYNKGSVDDGEKHEKKIGVIFLFLN